MLATALVMAMVIALPGLPAAAAPAQAPSLWLTDNATRMTYNVTPDGDVLSSFRPPGVRSSLAVDPVDRTLWGTSDGMASLILNFDREGNVLHEIDTTDFGGVRNEGIDVTVSTDDVTLWIVDDPVSGPEVPTVYNVTRSGELITSFPTSTFDPLSRSPQAIAYDPYSSSLWITDNSAERIYNVSTEGELLSSFPVDTATFGGVTNAQGITVESSQVLWFTARDTDRIYRVPKTGDRVLSSFPASAVDPMAADPTAIAFDRPPGYVGAAADFAVLGLAGSELKLKDADRSTGVVGDVGLGAGGSQQFDAGLLTGAFVVDPAADNTNGHDVAIADGVEARDLELATSDASFASVAASVLAPTSVLGEIKDSTALAGTAGTNVVDVTKIDLDNDETLTLRGDPSSTFVLNVAGKVKLNHASAIVTDGGVTADNVVINVEGTDDASIENGSHAVGTIVAARAKLKIKGAGSVLTGAVIGGREIALEDGGRLRDPATALPPGELGEAADPAVLGLPGSKVKIDDAGSTVDGDVALGPFSTQELDRGVITGRLLVDPSAEDDHDHDVTIAGGTVEQSLSRAVADAIDASYGVARLPADQRLPEIDTTTAVLGGPGLTVIASKKVELDGGETLTIEGGPSSSFVFNLAEKFKLKGASTVVLTGGVRPGNVIFNVTGDHDSSVEEGSSASGTIISALAKVKVTDGGSRLRGAAISGDEVVVEKSATVEHAQ